MKRTGSEPIRIDDVLLTRQLTSREGIDELAKDIDSHGLKTPILVRRNGLLVDGLRRISAVTQLGQEYVEAIITDDLDEIFTYLSKIPRPLTPRRIYEIYTATISAAYIRKMERTLKGRGTAEPLPESEYYTPKLLAALGIRSRNTLTRTAEVFRLAETGNVLAIEIAAQLDAGELTVGAAEGRLRAAYGMHGHITNGAEQKQLVESAMRTISGVLLALESMGSPININRKDLAEIVKSVQAHRTALNNFIRRFINQAEREMGKK